MTVKLSGPIYDGRAMAALDAYPGQLEDEIAKAGKTMVLTRFGQAFKYPTGHYASLIRTDRVAEGARITDDGKCPYGPWLEGIGSRNYPVTSFRGYRTFRYVGHALQRTSLEVAKVTLPALLARME